MRYKHHRETFTGITDTPSSAAAGISIAIQRGGLFIPEMAESGKMGIVIAKCDGPNAKEADLRLIISELQVYPELVIYLHIGSARILNNSVKWCLGDFTRGAF